MKLRMTLTLFSIFIFSFQLSGQIPFWPIGAERCQEIGCPADAPHYDIESMYNQDSIIQGKYCVLIRSSEYAPGPLGSIPHFVHQDSNKVYYYSPDENAFNLLYDFSLEQGNVYNIQVDEQTFLTDSVSVTILEKSVETLNGHEVVKQSVSIEAHSGEWAFTEIKIQEGVGGIHGNTLLFFTPFWTTSCYDNTIFYFTGETGLIPVQSTSFGVGCIALNTGSDLENNLDFHIFPNPSSGEINIRHSLSSIYLNAHIRINNSIGQIQKSIPIINQDKITIPNLLPGIYFISLIIEGNIMKTEKLIVY